MKTHRTSLPTSLAGCTARASGALRRQPLRCSFTVLTYTTQSAARGFLALHPDVSPSIELPREFIDLPAKVSTKF